MKVLFNIFDHLFTIISEFELEVWRTYRNDFRSFTGNNLDCAVKSIDVPILYFKTIKSVKFFSICYACNVKQIHKFTSVWKIKKWLLLWGLAGLPAIHLSKLEFRQQLLKRTVTQKTCMRWIYLQWGIY
jgi:hypothetical protein